MKTGLHEMRMSGSDPDYLKKADVKDTSTPDYDHTWVRAVHGSRRSGMGTIPTFYFSVMGATPDGKIKTISKHDFAEDAQKAHLSLLSKDKDKNQFAQGGETSAPRGDRPQRRMRKR
jgi:hypothetical protein